MSETPSAFDAQDAPSGALIDACVHCGFCLPACPTYVLDGEEMDSPRGRIYLMKAAQQGRVDLSETFVRHFDACLGCQGCVTACPSGVQYGPLLEATRSQIERRHPRGALDRAYRALLFWLMPHPARLRLALLPLALVDPLRRLAVRSGLTRALPGRLRSLIDLAPSVTAASLFARVPASTPGVPPVRQRVGLLLGCVQRLVQPHVHEATRHVLAAEGCEVVAPPEQGCCGALSLHVGRLEEARARARHTIAAFERAGVDRVVVNAAGCGSSMKEYGHLLKDDPAWAERAAQFAVRVRDVHEALTDLGPARSPRHPLPLRVVYQDACHMAHAQGIRREPRAVLREIPGLTLVDIGEADLCCGSAGIYNLVQPDTARRLGDRKADHIAAVQADVIASGNPGCALQIAAAGARAGHTWRIVHPIELIDASRRGASADTFRQTP